MKRRQKTNASRIRTSPPRRISRLATIPPSIARHQVTRLVAIRALTEAAIAVETAAQIGAVTVVATGNTSEAAAAEDVLAEEAEGAAVAAAISVKAAGISPRQNTLRQVVRTAVGTAGIQTVARRIAGLGATLTTAVRTPPAPRLLRSRPRNRLCCRVNRSRSIAGARYHKLPLPLQSPSASNSTMNPKSRSLVFRASRLPQTLLAVLAADCQAGFSPVLPQKVLRRPSQTRQLRKTWSRKHAARQPPKTRRRALAKKSTSVTRKRRNFPPV